MTQGIYVIRCLLEEKYYIGSSINIEDRINQHKTDLRRNKSHNKKMQMLYNKYKDTYDLNFIFKFELLKEVTDEDDLYRVEQDSVVYYIDMFGIDKILNTVGSYLKYPIRMGSRTYKRFYNIEVVSPANEEFLVKDLNIFCRMRGLNSAAFARMLDGFSYSSQGWKLKNPIPKIDYVRKTNTNNNVGRPKTPDHVKQKVIDTYQSMLIKPSLRKFALNFDVGYFTIRHILMEAGIDTSRGYKNKDTSKGKARKTKPSIKSTLDVSGIGVIGIPKESRKVTRGKLKQAILESERWTDEKRLRHGELIRKAWENRGIKSATVVSPEGVIYDVKRIPSFAKQYNLDNSDIYQLISGKGKIRKGWTLL